MKYLLKLGVAVALVAAIVSSSQSASAQCAVVIPEDLVYLPDGSLSYDPYIAADVFCSSLEACYGVKYKQCVSEFVTAAETTARPEYDVSPLPSTPDQNSGSGTAPCTESVEYLNDVPYVCDYCGDGTCQDELDGPENPGNCPDDCDSTCGDDICDCTETPTSCEEDCGCGNEIVETDQGEECDDGNQDSSDGCTNECLWNVCGDGYLYEDVEECDDGNTDSGDGCSSSCVVEYCGDYMCNNNETEESCCGDCADDPESCDDCGSGGTGAGAHGGDGGCGGSGGTGGTTSSTSTSTSTSASTSASTSTSTSTSASTGTGAGGYGSTSSTGAGAN